MYVAQNNSQSEASPTTHIHDGAGIATNKFSSIGNNTAKTAIAFLCRIMNDAIFGYVEMPDDFTLDCKNTQKTSNHSIQTQQNCSPQALFITFTHKIAQNAWSYQLFYVLLPMKS